MDRSVEVDELVEHWTLLDDEQGLAAGKRGATRLGFVLLLKFYIQHGRFPRDQAEVPDAAVRFVADQVRVPASDLGSYQWTGRTNRYHQARIRDHLGFRERSVEDGDRLSRGSRSRCARRSAGLTGCLSNCWVGAGRRGSSRLLRGGSI